MKGKKSQVFTLIAIALLILFFVSYETYSIIYERQAVKIRISTMGNFLFSFEEDLKREAYISGFRILFLAEDKIDKTGDYFSDAEDFNSFLQEAFFQGKVDGIESEVLYGATYNDILGDINEKAGKINVNIALSNPEISATQEDPWHVVVNLKFDLEMKDKENLASWKKKEDIKAYVEIEGFEDPLYTVNSRGKIIYKINRTIYEGNYVAAGDAGNLKKHLENRYYTNNSDAPSFLKRLRGELSGDDNGIESFVDLSALSAQGISTSEKSAVDHVYFSTNNPSSFTVAGMPSWFRIDEGHFWKYGIGG